MISNDISQLTELENLSEEERKLVLNILEEYSNSGKSEKYDNLIYEDYEEIPVTIEEFLHNPKYLGKGLINEEGKFTVFPYWENLLKEIFPDPLKPAKYNTLALTGSIGIGKSFIAVITGLYELYRMLCLKDPYLHYGLQPIDKITFAFMNITMDAAKGVAWDKCQQLLQSSEWFMSKGNVSKGNNPTWSPPKGIELIYGSQSRHIIGRAVYWCLDGDTKIATSLGDFKLKELVNKPIQVYNVDENNNIVLSDTCTVMPTATETTEYQIELEDGTLIKCTPSHRFMLKDGSYKEAQYLTENDDILEFLPVGYVYRVTNLINGRTHIGQHKKRFFDKNYYGSGLLISREVKKYGKRNFKIEILDWAKTIDQLNELETKYIAKEKTLNENCINLSDGALGGHENYNCKSKTYVNKPNKDKIVITDGFEVKYVDKNESIPTGWKKGNCHTAKKHDMSKYYSDPEKRLKKSLACRGDKNSQWGNGDAHRGERNGRYNKPVSKETRELISKNRIGKGTGKCPSKDRPGQPKPEGFSEIRRKIQSKRVYFLDNHKFYGDNSIIKYIKEIYDYNISSKGLISIINSNPRGVTLYPKLVDKIVMEDNR